MASLSVDPVWTDRPTVSFSERGLRFSVCSKGNFRTSFSLFRSACQQKSSFSSPSTQRRKNYRENTEGRRRTFFLPFYAFTTFDLLSDWKQNTFYVSRKSSLPKLRVFNLSFHFFPFVFFSSIVSSEWRKKKKKLKQFIFEEAVIK